MILVPTKENIQKVVVHLKGGGVACIPTDTVFGLICNALNDDAVKKIYEIKKRSESKPFPVFVRSVEEAKSYAVFNHTAEDLAKKFWPGKVTLVLKELQGSKVSKMINQIDNTIAFRNPNHLLSLKIMQLLNAPIVATSANITGLPTPETLEGVKNQLNNKDLILLGDVKIESGEPSTVIDCTKDDVQIVRGVLPF